MRGITPELMAKIEAERKAALARQADELRKAQEDARKAREALVKAEAEREAARKAAEEARAAATAAKSDREGASSGKAPPRSSGVRSGSNCFTFNHRTFCQ